MNDPGQSDSVLQSLAHKYSFDDWRGVNRANQGLFIWRFVLAGDELPGWRRERSQVVDQPGHARAVHSVWSRRRGATTSLLLLDAFECPSRVAGHDFLLQTLGQVQSPLIDRRQDTPVGDIAFSGPGQSLMLFARANVVFFLRNAGGDAPDVPDLAAGLDEQVAAEPQGALELPPKPAGKLVLPLTAPPIPEALVLGEKSPLRIEGAVPSSPREAPPPSEDHRWYKCFSSSGDFELEDGEPVYVHGAEQPPDVRIYVVDP